MEDAREDPRLGKVLAAGSKNAMLAKPPPARKAANRGQDDHHLYGDRGNLAASMVAVRARFVVDGAQNSATSAPTISTLW